MLPTIASLTLGPTRPFHLRPVQKVFGGAPLQNASIMLPHNSLLVMYPPCQELYLHSLPQYKNLTPHSASGLGHIRLNLTFRVWRKKYLELSQSKQCKCGQRMVLRRLKKQESDTSRNRWGWMCQMSFKNMGRGCDMFEMFSHESVVKMS